MGDVTVPCKKCGNKVPASSLKLDLDIELMVCQECIKNKSIHKEIESDVFHIKEVKEVPKEKSSKTAHKCASCGYKFKIDIETKIPKNCPYCNARVLIF